MRKPGLVRSHTRQGSVCALLILALTIPQTIMAVPLDPQQTGRPIGQKQQTLPPDTAGTQP